MFQTPSMNEFCYAKPMNLDRPTIVSQIVGNDLDFDGGEMHFDSTIAGTSYFTMKFVERLEGSSVLLTFGDRDGKVSGSFFTDIKSFEFPTTIEKFDTFVSHCNNEEGTNVLVIQYLGIETIDDTDYFVTWHISADLKNPITCDYPEIIQHSLNHDFGI